MATTGASKLNPPLRAEDHVQGPLDAPAVLVEYGDFECPYCGRAYPVVKEVMESMGEQAALVFRHFPLTQVHPHAQFAAEAAEAAGAQGKFWEMHGLLFQNQQALATQALIQYAATLALDVERFTKEMSGRVYEARVKQDFLSGVRSGVNGTPTFFINGVRHDGEAGRRELEEALRLAVAGT